MVNYCFSKTLGNILMRAPWKAEIGCMSLVHGWYINWLKDSSSQRGFWACMHVQYSLLFWNAWWDDRCCAYGVRGLASLNVRYMCIFTQVCTVRVHIHVLFTHRFITAWVKPCRALFVLGTNIFVLHWSECLFLRLVLDAFWIIWTVLLIH